ncbi:MULTISPECIES: DUF1836 domain-containing protein [unclassified Paenibacillus]|uniref:DUF1836 domain-containing protein n=1 Tax=unclassified Paenibacillus TaxID=185978 RepID=UPI0036D38053
MDAFTLTREELAHLLGALGGRYDEKPSEILRKAWGKTCTTGRKAPGEPNSPLPPIVLKLMRSSDRRGFSLHEIAELGSLLEGSTLSVTSMQNWVKRDFKPYFQCPMAGKKYSLDQTAMLLMIDDLKSSLDFETIRRLFALLFVSCEDAAAARPEGLSPLSMLDCYAALYQKLYHEWESVNMERTEQAVRAEADKAAMKMLHIDEEQKTALGNLLLVAVISIQAGRLQAMARRYSQEILFLGKA